MILLQQALTELPSKSLQSLVDNFATVSILIALCGMLYKVWRKSEAARELLMKENSDLKNPIQQLTDAVKEMLTYLRK